MTNRKEIVAAKNSGQSIQTGMLVFITHLISIKNTKNWLNTLKLKKEERGFSFTVSLFSFIQRFYSKNREISHNLIQNGIHNYNSVEKS